MKQGICLVGAGGSAKSVYQLLEHMGRANEVIAFLESADCWQPRSLYGREVRSIETFEPERHQALIALGSSEARARMALLLPPHTEYVSLIHPLTTVFGPDEFQLGPGSIIFPSCLISRGVSIGAHSVVMAGCILGHDSQIGDFFTTASRLNLGGECRLGHSVYCGMSVSIRDKTSICDQAVIGMGAVVIKDISEPGVYAGNPARKIR
ncbi:MAG: hypothetical protein ACAI44_34975 [Candidatus Sericytochromatia bacterium]